MSDITLMKNFSTYRLSSHFGAGLAGHDQRLSHFLTPQDQEFPQDQRTSFIERKLSVNVKLVQSRRDGNVLYWASIRTRKPLKKFCTGSRYLGEWNAIDFSGEGIYRYPHGVIYEGEFNKIGLFHGLGTLIYPNGQKLQGMWKNGRLEDDNTYIFSCHEILDENFKYCHIPDRRFHIEIQKDFGPVGQEYLTADQPTKQLRAGCYDVGLGYYDPKLHCIFSYPETDEESIVRHNKPITLSVDEEKVRLLKEISAMSAYDKVFPYFGKKGDQFTTTDNSFITEVPTKKKVKWIEKNCRRAWDEPTGFRPDFYEKWMVGRKQEAFLNIPSSLRSVIDEVETLLSKTRKPTSKIVSFIQMKDLATTKSRQKKKITGALKPTQKPEKKKGERRTIHNKT